MWTIHSHEAWSRGLTPSIFWENEEIIRKASRDSIDDTIDEISLASKAKGLTLSSPTESNRRGQQIRQTGLWIDFGTPSQLDNGNTTTPSILLLSTTSPTLPTPNPHPNPANPHQLIITTRTAKQGYQTFFNDLVEPCLKWVGERLEGEEGVTIFVGEFEKQNEANDLGGRCWFVYLVRFPRSFSSFSFLTLVLCDQPSPVLRRRRK